MEKVELSESSGLLWRTWHNVLHFWKSWTQLVISGAYCCVVLLTPLLSGGGRGWPGLQVSTTSTIKPVCASRISLNCMWEGVKDQLPQDGRSPSFSPIPRDGPTRVSRCASEAHARGLKPTRPAAMARGFMQSTETQNGPNCCGCSLFRGASRLCHMLCRQQRTGEGSGGRQRGEHRHEGLRDEY